MLMLELSLIQCWTWIPFSSAEALAPLFSLGLKQWRLYQGVVSAVIALTSLAWLGLPETDSWLGLGHQKDESKEDDEVETGDSAGDGKEDEVETGEQTGPECGSFSVTFILAICWMTISVLYYGLSLPADTIHITDNLYVAFVTSALIELPFQVILPFPADILGRRYVFSFIQIVPGIVCVVVRFLSPGSVVFSSLTLLAKGTVAAAKTLGTRLFKICNFFWFHGFSCIS